MNDLWLSDEEIHGKEPTWQEQEIEKLKNKIEKLEFQNESLTDTINLAKEKIKLDIDVNKRCLKEDTSKHIKELLNQELRFDYELMDLLDDCNE